MVFDRVFKDQILQEWMSAMEDLHGDVPQLQRHFWAAAYQIALFRDALALAR